MAVNINQLFKNIRPTNVFRSLQYRNYKLYFIGQGISLIGTWMQRMAVSWLVYTLTHSAFMLGVVTFAGQIPSFILSPYAGVITDKYNKYHILLITQVAAMIQAGILATIVLTGHYNITAILTLSVMLGIINAFDVPSRQSMINNLIEKREDLPNAIALNSTMVNLARLLGPVAAGVILAEFGEGICFLLNAISFIAVIICLLYMRIPYEPVKKSNNNVWIDFKEGFIYLKNNAPIRRMIILLGLISLIMMPFSTLLPVFAKDVFKGNAGTFGLLNGTMGAGALTGALYLAASSSAKLKFKVVLFTIFLFGSSILLFACTTFLPLALFFIASTGIGMMMFMATGNTYLQTNVSDQMRGRVMSFYAMAFFGMMPIGSFFIGMLAEYTSAATTLKIEGITGILIATIFTRQVLVKR